MVRSCGVKGHFGVKLYFLVESSSEVTRGHIEVTAITQNTLCTIIATISSAQNLSMLYCTSLATACVSSHKLKIELMMGNTHFDATYNSIGQEYSRGRGWGGGILQKGIYIGTILWCGQCLIQ